MSAQRIAYLRSKIAEIDQALLDMALGKRIAEMNYDGQVVKYGPQDTAGLVALLKQLRQQAQTELELLTGRGRRGPFRMAY